MERKNLWALGGVAVLAAAGTVLFVARNSGSETALAADQNPAHRQPLEPNAPVSEGKQAIDLIQTLGLPAATRKQLIVSYLTSVVAPPARPFAYWEPVAVRDAGARIQKFETDEAVRRLLSTEFGADVANDPDFAFLFKPFGDRYPSLNSAKQLALQGVSLMPARALIQSELSPIQGQVQVRAAQLAMEVEVAKLLSPQELQEYLRQESPAARALASGGFRFTQREFDAVLPVVAAKAGADVGVRSFDAATTANLRNIMGEKRYMEYRKSQDPTFHMLSAIVAAHGGQGANLDAAYAAIYKNQELAAEMFKAGPVLGFQAQKDKDRMTANLRRQLSANIGSEATDILMRSMDANPGLVQARMF